MDARRKRLLFRAQHCGMKENDIMLGGFAAARVGELDDAQVGRFEALLDQSDNDIYNWVSGRAVPPAEFENDLLDMLKNYNKTK